MKKLNLVMMLGLFGLSLVVVAAANAEDTERGKILRATPATPSIQSQVSTPTSPSASGVPGGSGPSSFAGGCCQKPPPEVGLDCCDTRDCGWFSCDDVITAPKKVYRR